MKLFAKQSSSGDGRVFRSGVWSAAIASAVIVLAVLVNLIVRAIPSGIPSSISPRRGSTP